MRSLSALVGSSASKDVTSSKQKLPFAVHKGDGRGQWNVEERKGGRGWRKGQRACDDEASGRFSSGTEELNTSKPVGPVPSKNHPVSEPLRDRGKVLVDRVERAGEEGSWEMRLTVSCLIRTHPPSFSSENQPSD